MTDQEIICTFMEPKPDGGCPVSTDSPGAWWRAVHVFEDKHLKFECWQPRRLSLNALWEVEERLQWEARNAHDPEPCMRRNRYIEHLSVAVNGPDLWHATPEQKIKALAAVLGSADGGGAGCR